ncbi:MAG: hypothetical protein IJ303_02575, partial [Clostridia bacterium]|nr:hypothetical protein [Clostridia bacterium]
MRSEIFTVSKYTDLSGFNMKALAPHHSLNWNFAGQPVKTVNSQYDLDSPIIWATAGGFTAEFTSEPNEPIDAFSHRKIAFAAMVDGSEQLCQVLLTLRSGEQTLECKGEISSGEWNVITFDIGTWKYRKEITHITFSLVGSVGNLPLGDINFSGPYVNETDVPRMEKFMSYGLYASGLEIEILDRGTPDEALQIFMDSQRVNISGSAAVPYTENSCNAVRIVLSNDSALESMKFSYNYIDGISGKLVAVVKNIPIQPNSSSCAYLINTCAVDLLASFSIILDSYSSGSVTIHSISPVSVYQGYPESRYGIISSCISDEKSKSILISGRVYYDFLIAHNDYELLCYKLRTNDSFEAALSRGDSPIASSKMSSDFKFDIKLSKLDELALISKYAVAARSPEGTHILLSPPVSISGDFGSVETSSGRSNIKGLNSQYLATATSCGVGCSIVDVYLDRLINSSRSGHLYSVEDTYLYFDSEYTSYLDRQIKNLYSAGCKVYLRLLIDANADTSLLPYTATAENEYSAQLLGVMPCTDEAEKHFFAAVDFLAKRYSVFSHGKISGMILGKSVDMAEKYNFMGNIKTSDYMENLAKALDIMARTAVISIPNVEIILPVSDSRKSDTSIDIELLLISLSRYFDQSGGLAYALMIESTHTPYSLNSSIFENPEEQVLFENPQAQDQRQITPETAAPSSELKAADENSNYYCTDNIHILEKMLLNLAKTYKSVPKSYIYSWSPKTDEIGGGLSAAYIYSYYKIMFSSMASSFIIDMPKDDEGELGIKKLSYLMKYIDTERNNDLSLCNFALEIFEAESWPQLINGFDSKLIKYRAFYEIDPVKSLPNDIKGSYALWDFTSFAHTDWFGGNGACAVCSDISPSGKRSLCAIIPGDMGGDNYAEIVYNYEYPEYISLLPYIEFDFEISDGGKNTLYEITV